MRRNEGKQPIDPAGISAMDLPRTRFQFVLRTPSPDVSHHNPPPSHRLCYPHLFRPDGPDIRANGQTAQIMNGRVNPQDREFADKFAPFTRKFSTANSERAVGRSARISRDSRRHDGRGQRMVIASAETVKYAGS
jgi:hypothetical protein